MNAIEKLVYSVKNFEEFNFEPLSLATHILEYVDDIDKSLNEIKVSFGRFLITQSESITCQLHIHSPQYQGSIHDHGTWGIMIPIRGSFLLEDWMVISESDSFKLRNYILDTGSLVQFDYKNGFDWHRNKNLSNSKAVSLHLYGKNYNNEIGRHFDEINKKIVNSKRSKMISFFDL